MSLETITNGISETTEKLSDETVLGLGQTVFEKLSEEEVESSSQQIESIVSIDMMNSVTRLSDGQTVPDER